MAGWKAITVKPSNKVFPQLYAKAVISDSSYAIYLTDLIYVWAEHLDRRAIMRRAMDENTTIDPTNGPDQLKHLLEHIAGSLDGKPGTSARISSKSGLQQVMLRLVSKLPAPLEPLRWPLTLSMETQACFSSELLQPTLAAVREYRVGFEALLSLVKDKDNVIQKLQDK